MKDAIHLIGYFITTLECNIYHFMVSRVNEPLVRFKMAITLELKLCLSNFSKGIEGQKLRLSKYKHYFNFHASS